MNVIADGWYSWVIDDLPAFSDWLARVAPWLAWLAWRVGPLRAVLLFAASTRRDVVAVTFRDRGWRSLLLLRACLGRRRKLVVLHFIEYPPAAVGVRRLLDRAWDPIARLATRRALLTAQVMSEGERDLYAARYRLPPGRFRYLPFAWRRTQEGALPDASPDGVVVSIGRSLCDWPTLMAAAEGGDWPLLVVCGRADLPLLERRNADGRATVVCELPEEEARAQLRRATVCAICVHDESASAGHVRLMDAVDAGVAVVASNTQALRDYAIDGETALLVPPRDPHALLGAIERLIGEPTERERLRSAAFERARAWTWPAYLEAVEALVRGRSTPLPR